jgi:hypothetical protein
MLLVTALVSASLLAGCGALSKSEYQKQMKAVGKKADKQFKSFKTGQPSAKSMTKASKALDSVADDVEDITPPSDVESLHKRLIKVLRKTARTIKKLGPLMDQAMKDPTKIDQKQMESVQKDMADVQTEMDSIQKGYKKKKYDVGFDDE